jgi:integrase
LTESFPRQDFFEPKEVESILSRLPGYLQDYVLFTWLSGWRKGSISSLTWEHVHKGEIRVPTSKNGESLVLSLTGDLLSLIRMRPSERVEDCPYVFHRCGAFIRDFRKAWYKATKKARGPWRVFHALRRSSARDRIRAGVHG